MRLAHIAPHFFYPQESNNHRARILHIPWLAIIALFIIFFQSLIHLASSPGVKILGYASQISPQEVVNLTNEQRQGQDLSSLEYSEVLSQAALNKGQHMLEHDYWAHVAPDGTEPWEFFKSAGYKYRYAGENLARDFSNPSSAIGAWMASPTHRDNMLSDRYTEIGIAVVEGDLNGVDTTIIVQLFGTKLSGQTPAIPVAAAEETVPSPAPVLTKTITSEPKLATLPVVANNSTLTGAEMSATGKISPLEATKIFSLVLALMLIIALAVDGYIVTRRQITRVAGRALAHISFMGMVLAIILIIKAGQIL